MSDIDNEDPFAIFDELEFEDIDAGIRTDPIRVSLKKSSTGVALRLLLTPEIAKEMGIRAGDHMKLQGADMDEDIAFKISKATMETQTIARKNKVGARKEDKADLGLIINFIRMNDFGAAAFDGCPDPSNRQVKGGALLLLLPAGENPVIRKQVKTTRPGGKKLPAPETNKSDIVFKFYGNKRFKPTQESDAVVNRLVSEGKSFAQIEAYFGGQVPAADLKARYNQTKRF